MSSWDMPCQRGCHTAEEKEKEKEKEEKEEKEKE